MTKEEWEKETDEYKIEWGNRWLKKGLTRGPTFRFTSGLISYSDPVPRFPLILGHDNHRDSNNYNT